GLGGDEVVAGPAALPRCRPGVAAARPVRVLHLLRRTAWKPGEGGTERRGAAGFNADSAPGDRGPPIGSAMAGGRDAPARLDRRRAQPDEPSDRDRRREVAPSSGSSRPWPRRRESELVHALLWARRGPRILGRGAGGFASPGATAGLRVGA